jgi:hypothetical protein
VDAPVAPAASAAGVRKVAIANVAAALEKLGAGLGWPQ